MGPATQFNATLTNWTEDFQDGFTEFKTAEDDGFDFPPFSVAHAQADKGAQDTNQGNVDPFGDNFAVPSSSEVTANSGAATDRAEAVPEAGEKANTPKVDMEPVVLAPEVPKDPVIQQSASTVAATNEQGSTVASKPNTTQSESPGGAVVELEKVPLADPEAPRLQATESLDTSSTPKESATNSSAKTPSSPTTNVGATVETKT